MKRVMQILSLVSLASVYVTAGNCVMSGDGWSFVDPLVFIRAIPVIGPILAT